MKKSSIFILLIIFFGCFFAFGNKSKAAMYYVDVNNGQDTNMGTSAEPFKTIQKGVNKAQSGDTINVRDGIYTTKSDDLVLFSGKNGTVAKPIILKSEKLHGAVLDGRNNETLRGIAICSSNIAASAYITVDGFEIRNFAYSGLHIQGTTAYCVSKITIKNNWIHDIGRWEAPGTSTTTCLLGSEHVNGRAGGYSNPFVDDITWDSNLINNIGRIPNLTCDAICGATVAHNYRHDHGLYLQGNNHIVKNNVIYNLYAGWGIKIDGHWDKIPPAAHTFTIINNTFAFDANPNPAGDYGGHITFFNNREDCMDGSFAENPHDVLIENNILYNPPDNLDTAISISYERVIRYCDRAVVKNNITTAGSIAEENLSKPPSGLEKVVIKDNKVKTDPLLLNADSSSPDFHLRPDSPAINAGLNVGFSVDYDGNPIIGIPDIGAYEYQGRPAAPKGLEIK